MGRKKAKLTLGHTRERLCEAGKQCNNYRICFDKNDNPTGECAVAFCTIYAEDEIEDTSRGSLPEQVQDIISNFTSYKENNGNGHEEDCNDIWGLDDVLKVLHGVWYIMQDSRRFTPQDKKYFELALRLLELLQ